MAKLRGQKVSSAFWSGFVASGFSAPKSFGVFKGTMITSVTSGIVSRLTGGKFANGAVTGAFVHLFNALSQEEFKAMQKRASAVSSAYEKAFGNQAHSYMFDKTPIVDGILNVGKYAVSYGIGVAYAVEKLGYNLTTQFAAFATTTLTAAGASLTSYLGFGVADPQGKVEDMVIDYVSN